MKILYAIQGTGNGHMSRAHEVAPVLEKYGEVDYMVSGAQVEICLPKTIKYRSHGLGFYFGKKGGVNIGKTISKNASKRIFKEVKDFPIDSYDLLINDFEPITAWSARLKRKKCIGLSHQSALLSKNCPRPQSRDVVGKIILNRYAPATNHYGFHFSSFDKNIFTPIVKKEIRQAESKNLGHYTVYLPAYSDSAIIGVLHNIKDVEWQVFSKHSNKGYKEGNATIHPIDSNAFIKSMTTSAGVLCGAGFETPSEALYLGKKLMVIPMKNQYEQFCNAAALEQMGVPVISTLNISYLPEIMEWVNSGKVLQIDYPDETDKVIEQVINEHLSS